MERRLPGKKHTPHLVGHFSPGRGCKKVLLDRAAKAEKRFFRDPSRTARVPGGVGYGFSHTDYVLLIDLLLLLAAHGSLCPVAAVVCRSRRSDSLSGYCRCCRIRCCCCKRCPERRQNHQAHEGTARQLRRGARNDPRWPRDGPSTALGASKAGPKRDPKSTQRPPNGCYNAPPCCSIRWERPARLQDGPRGEVQDGSGKTLTPVQRP